MYIYLDKQGIVKEIINDEALRQSASNANEIYVYYDGLQETDIGSVLATYGLPDGTITDEMQVATQTQESEIPYNAERDLKYFQYYKAYPFYHFAIADLALSQEGVVRLMIRLAQKDGEYIKVAGLICFDVEGELVKEDHGVSLAQYNYLVKAWINANGFLPIDGSKAMQGNLDMGAHNVILNGKTLKDNNGALNYNGKDLAKQEDVSPLQGDVATLKSDNTKNKSDIASLKTDNVANKADISALKTDNTQNKENIVGLQTQIDTINATQNVVDIVGTKAELNAYATKDLHANDKIEVLTDESQNNANTIYEWNGNAWSLVGSKAPYYSKSESDARYNELKAKSYDKDTTEYVTGHVPDSGLVKKSLDGISENLETTKTQVDTNKTNIATLQSDVSNLKSDNETTKTTITGLVNDNATNKENITTLQNDVASLKTDNQTTKTTIAGLVSSDTQNKKDIATLKSNYTQVQSQANKNSSDIALLETNAVKKDTDASLKSLTLPSASDLKTKDGTGFGGGYNTQRIDITTILSQEDILSLIESLTGHLENPSFTFDFTFTNNINNPTADEIDLYLDMSAFGETGFIDLFFIKSSKQDGIRYANTYMSYAGRLIRCGGMAITGTNNILTTIYGGGLACVDYALKTDLNAKQATLYRHTIEIWIEEEATLILTTESIISTEINTMDKFISAFKGSELACICTRKDTDNAWKVFYIGIQVGTTLNDTSMMSTNVLDTGTTFTDVFGTSGYTMEDKVKPL